MKKVKQFKYENGKWNQINDEKVLHEINNLKIGTFNVLFDRNHGSDYKPHIVCSKIRYQAQMEEFKKMDFDILTLNEVTHQYLDILKSNEWIQKTYFVTDVNGENIKNFGNVILSKYCMKSVKGIKISTLSRFIIVGKLNLKIGNDKHRLYIASAHLKAVSTQYERRRKQLDQIYNYLDKKVKNHSKIILGDLNFHSDFEDKFIRKDFIDVWKETSNNDGYTFDSYENNMIYEIFPISLEFRRMRLDRILLSSNFIKPQKVEFFCNKPIYDNLKEYSFDPIYCIRWPLRSVSSTLFDFFEINLWRDPKEYLFPSDHFGIYAEFTINSK